MPSPSAFVVIAEFTAKDGAFDALARIAAADAAGSITEPGCRQFDVVRPDDRPGNVVLYEVYDDRAAFDAHQRTPHYATFKRDVADATVGAPVVRFCTRLA